MSTSSLELRSVVEYNEVSSEELSKQSKFAECLTIKSRIEECVKTLKSAKNEPVSDELKSYDDLYTQGNRVQDLKNALWKGSLLEKIQYLILCILFKVSGFKKRVEELKELTVEKLKAQKKCPEASDKEKSSIQQRMLLWGKQLQKKEQELLIQSKSNPTSVVNESGEVSKAMKDYMLLAQMFACQVEKDLPAHLDSIKKQVGSEDPQFAAKHLEQKRKFQKEVYALSVAYHLLKRVTPEKAQGKFYEEGEELNAYREAYNRYSKEIKALFPGLDGLEDERLSAWLELDNDPSFKIWPGAVPYRICLNAS